jgi:hypothetical protein
LTRLTRLGTAFAALALAACVDTQAPDNSPTTPTTSKPDLPVMETMRVTGPATNGSAGFTITLRFINAPTTAQRAFFETAAAKWQAAIVGDVPDTEGIIPARSCGGSFKTPTFSGFIDDVLIDVLLQPIDGPGGTLGTAGPCLIRSADFLTAYGLMFFDTADLASLAQAGVFDEVVVHEMGHVLGIGTLWDFNRDLLQGTAADPRFVGPNAIAGFHDVGGRGATIPVEDGGGPGTRFSHWDEETFDAELMTGFIALGESPLSVMTIGSMQDLGYVVNNNAADRYQVTGHQERVDDEAATASVRINLGARERLIRPVGVVN